MPRAIFFKACVGEYTYKLLSATIYAFELSGAKSAAVAPAIGSEATTVVPFTTKIWFGVSTVSDTIMLAPFGEMARIFPGAAGTDVSAGADWVLAAGATIDKPTAPSLPVFVPR